MNTRDIGTSEWVVAAVSAVLLLIVCGYLVYDAVRSTSRPPAFEFRIDTILPTGSRYLVRFHAVNRGDETASNVVIEGVLSGPSGALETAEAHIDYAPAQGRATAGLYFSRDPRNHRLDLAAKGYETP